MPRIGGGMTTQTLDKTTMPEITTAEAEAAERAASMSRHPAGRARP